MHSNLAFGHLTIYCREDRNESKRLQRESSLPNQNGELSLQQVAGRQLSVGGTSRFTSIWNGKSVETPRNGDWAPACELREAGRRPPEELPAASAGRIPSPVGKRVASECVVCHEHLTCEIGHAQRHKSHRPTWNQNLEHALHFSDRLANPLHWPCLLDSFPALAKAGFVGASSLAHGSGTLRGREAWQTQNTWLSKKLQLCPPDELQIYLLFRAGIPGSKGPRLAAHPMPRLPEASFTSSNGSVPPSGWIVALKLAFEDGFPSSDTSLEGQVSVMIPVRMCLTSVPEFRPKNSCKCPKCLQIKCVPKRALWTSVHSTDDPSCQNPNKSQQTVARHQDA